MKGKLAGVTINIGSPVTISQSVEEAEIHRLIGEGIVKMMSNDPVGIVDIHFDVEGETAARTYRIVATHPSHPDAEPALKTYRV